MENQKSRTRKKQLKFYISEQEYSLIKNKMEQLNTNNFSHYARKMLIDGYIFNLNSCTELQKLIYEINKIGININQLTKLANENHSISKSVVNQIAKTQEELQQIIKEKVAIIFGNN